MTDKVRTIRPDVIASEGKQHMLDTIAQAFDAAAATDGSEPVAVVFALVTESGGCRTGYHTLSCIDGRNALHISRAVTCINMDLSTWDEAYRV